MKIKLRSLLPSGRRGKRASSLLDEVTVQCPSFCPTEGGGEASPDTSIETTLGSITELLSSDTEGEEKAQAHEIDPSLLHTGPKRTVAFLSVPLGVQLTRGPDGYVRVKSVSSKPTVVRRGDDIRVGDVVLKVADIDMSRPSTSEMWATTVAFVRNAPRPITFVVASGVVSIEAEQVRLGRERVAAAQQEAEVERQRLEQERVAAAQQKAEAKRQRLERFAAAQQEAEAERQRLKQERAAAAQRKAATERQRLEKELVAAAQQEAAAERQRLEKEFVAAAQQEAAAERQRLEQELIATEREVEAERQRLEQERIAAEQDVKAERQRLEQERIAAEQNVKAERQRLEKELIAAAQKKEEAERQRLEKELASLAETEAETKTENLEKSIKVDIAEAGEMMESLNRALEQKKTEFVEAEKRWQLEEEKARLAAAQLVPPIAEDNYVADGASNDEYTNDDVRVAAIVKKAPNLNRPNTNGDPNDAASEIRKGLSNPIDLDVSPSGLSFLDNDNEAKEIQIASTKAAAARAALLEQAKSSDKEPNMETVDLNRINSTVYKRLLTNQRLLAFAREAGGSRLSTATEATEFSPMAISDDLINELMTEDLLRDELLQLYPLVDRIDDVVCSGAVCSAVLEQLLVGFNEGGDGEEDGDSEEDGDDL
eukprot:CAMPEP_0185826332 /NCGR_PEP_ID=MMETSP1322-20130828/31490_1 /TAXON_ID=265543 /ORGANISM="Minutocellus polymorphus, Strain RCC2270" /LENGTH=656 /DNA_ID=CAMNT_0028524059 /DNA_START=39 /DNA_END=2009 /DNA_ORIENTATION=-